MQTLPSQGRVTSLHPVQLIQWLIVGLKTDGLSSKLVMYPKHAYIVAVLSQHRISTNYYRGAHLIGEEPYSKDCMWQLRCMIPNLPQCWKSPCTGHSMWWRWIYLHRITALCLSKYNPRAKYSVQCKNKVYSAYFQFSIEASYSSSEGSVYGTVWDSQIPPGEWQWCLWVQWSGPTYMFCVDSFEVIGP